MIKNKVLIIFICLLVLIPEASLAQVAKLSNIAIARDNDKLLFKVNLDGAFTDDIKKAITSGVATSFTFYINLYKINNLLFRSKISEILITNTIKYDNLKNVYTVSRSWKNGEPATTESFKEAQELMTQIDGLKIAGMDKLGKNNSYRIEAKAELSKFTLPFYLHYIFIFVSYWDVETDWYLIEFVY